MTPDTPKPAAALVNAAVCRVADFVSDLAHLSSAPGGRPRFAQLARPPVCRCLFAGLLAATTLAGCVPPAFIGFPPQTRGNNVDSRELAQLVPGTSSRADVTALLGSPTTHATFDDNTWLYISEVTKPEIAGTNAVMDQQVVALTFDQQGVLRNISHKTQKDSVPVAVVSATTPSPGKEVSFWAQLLGNVGKFSPVQTSPDATRQGGAANPGAF